MRQRPKRDKIVKDFKQALDETGLVVPMATTNLFTDPAFKDGAFTANDPKVRAYALQKTMHAIDLGVETRGQRSMYFGAAGKERKRMLAKNPLDAGKKISPRLELPV